MLHVIANVYLHLSEWVSLCMVHVFCSQNEMSQSDLALTKELSHRGLT